MLIKRGIGALVVGIIGVSCSHSQKEVAPNTNQDLPMFRQGDGERYHLHSHESDRVPAAELPPAVKNATLYQDPEKILRSTPSDDAKVPKFNRAVKSVRVTVLSDMVVSRRTRAEWGFAALVEGKDADNKEFTILFDTGAEPQTVWDNACRMSGGGIENGNCVLKTQPRGLQDRICKASTVILSHNHQDHTAGLLFLRKRCKENGFPNALSVAMTGGKETFFSRPDYSANKLEDNYFIRPYFESNVPSTPPPGRAIFAEAYVGTGGKFVDSGQPRELAPGIWLTGKVPRRTTFEVPYYQNAKGEVTSTTPMVNPEDGKTYLDDVPEDHSLVINTEKGLVVITGCAHAGVVNIVNRARATFGGAPQHPIAMVIGGVHLITASTSGLKQVARGLKEAGVKKLLGAHCTGLEVVNYLRNKNELGNDAFGEKDLIFSTVGMAAAYDPASNIADFTFELPKGGRLNVNPSTIPGR